MATQKDYKPELRKLGASLLQEIIRRVVEAANPDRIILSDISQMNPVVS